MVRYLLGLLTALLFIGSVCGMLFLFDQGDAVDLKPSVLLALSEIPGWEEVAEAYKLGLTESKYLAEQKKLIAEETAILEERAEKLLESERALDLEWKKYELEKARAQRGNNQPTTTAASSATEPSTAGDPQSVARLLEAMKPEQAGENILKLPFEQGLAILSIRSEERRVGKECRDGWLRYQ